MHLQLQVSSSMFTHSEVIVLTNKHTNKQTPLKTSNAPRYATTLGNKSTLLSIQFAANLNNHNKRLYTAVVQLARQRICNSQDVSLSPSCAPLHGGLGQATYICVPLSPSSIIWYPTSGVISLAGKVTVGLLESTGSLPPGLRLRSMLHLQFSRTILSRECATKSRNKVAYAVTVQLHAAYK